MGNPPFWWYLPGKIGIFMGYVSLPEGNKQIKPNQAKPNKPNKHLWVDWKHLWVDWTHLWVDWIHVGNSVMQHLHRNTLTASKMLGGSATQPPTQQLQEVYPEWLVNFTLVSSHVGMRFWKNLFGIILSPGFGWSFLLAFQHRVQSQIHTVLPTCWEWCTRSRYTKCPMELGFFRFLCVAYCGMGYPP